MKRKKWFRLGYLLNLIKKIGYNTTENYDYSYDTHLCKITYDYYKMYHQCTIENL